MYVLFELEINLEKPKHFLFSQTSRVKFSQMRRDVMEKLELVDAKFQSDFPQIAKSILRRRGQHQKETAAALALTSVFPIEADLEQATLMAASATEDEEVDQQDPLQAALEEANALSLIQLD